MEGRILCIDYGSKRTGLAVTDTMQIIAQPLTTLHTKDVFEFLEKYFKDNIVVEVIIGWPQNLDGTDTHATPLVKAFINRFIKLFPNIPIYKVDEQFTSKLAGRAMIEMNMKKKERQKKENIDMLAAAIMLQDYLTTKSKL